MEIETHHLLVTAIAGDDIMTPTVGGSIEDENGKIIFRIFGGSSGEPVLLHCDTGIYYQFTFKNLAQAVLENA